MCVYICTYLYVYLYGYSYGAHIPRSVCVCICISHIHTYMHTYIRVHICSCSHARFASDSDPSTGKYDGKVESGLCVGFRTGPRIWGAQTTSRMEKGVQAWRGARGYCPTRNPEHSNAGLPTQDEVCRGLPLVAAFIPVVRYAAMVVSILSW